MKIVIDIPSRMVKDIKNSYSIHYGEADIQKILKAIKKGDILPKNYERFIDADAYLEHESPDRITEDILQSQLDLKTQCLGLLV